MAECVSWATALQCLLGMVAFQCLLKLNAGPSWPNPPLHRPESSPFGPPGPIRAASPLSQPSNKTLNPA